MNAETYRYWHKFSILAVAVVMVTAWAATPVSERPSTLSPSRHDPSGSEQRELNEVRLCQACGPECEDGFRPLTGVDGGRPGCGEPDWRDQRLIPWQEYGQGEYVG